MSKSPAKIFDSRWVGLCFVLLVALLLTVVFWRPFWMGGGLIGGDTYTYFFPQKTVLAESLAAGEFPLWNNRTGFGYPLVAESQTGLLYPPNHLFYRLLDVNAAYQANQLLHYVLAFLFTWLYARKVGLEPGGALFAAVIYTYGWFPARMCLEWAILGGAWLPAALWSVECFLQSRQWKYLFALSAALALSMLAGHFNLAFITQLVLLLYVPLRMWFAAEKLPVETRGLRRRCCIGLAVALISAFGVAAIQLAPTWELRGLSQRSSAANTGYGHIPAWYWSQVIMPWKWYAADDLDGLLNSDLPPGTALTNKIEAHLYFGLAPLAVIGIAAAVRFRAVFSRLIVLWALLGVAALLYTPGWLLPLTRWLPGFSFFMGPGRYGIVVTLAVAMIAGHALDVLRETWKSRKVCLLIGVVFLATIIDLWYVSRAVTNVFLLSQPPFASLPNSPVANTLRSSAQPTRLYAPGANLTNLLGTSAYPVYLGLGPAEYFDASLPLPAPFSLESPPAADQLAAVQQAGITHILSGTSLQELNWPVELVWAGIDPFLHRAWGRSAEQPLFLYRLTDGRGLMFWQQPNAGDSAEIVERRANLTKIKTVAPSGGRLVLRDLAYPGWKVLVDGAAAEPLVYERLYRAVDVPAGEHTVTWVYEPASFYWGAGVTLLVLLAWAIAGHFRFWYPQRFDPFGSQTTEQRPPP